MSEGAIQEALDSFAKAGKQMGIGESVGRIWGYLLLTASPVTQREIEESTGLSRGLISKCLQGTVERTVVEVKTGGRENLYCINPSLAASFGELVGRQYKERIKLAIEFLAKFSATIRDKQLRASVRSIIGEYKKVSIAFLLFPKIIARINETNVDIKDVEEMAKRISLKIEGERKE